MKTSLLRLLLIFLAVTASAETMAATISGNISYSGASTGKTVVAVFTDSTFDSSPTTYIVQDSPGNYFITGLSNGTYYVVSVKTNSLDNMKLTDPWGVYGSPGSIAPVTISGSNSVSGIDIPLVDGTEGNSNPFYRKYISPKLTTQLPEITQAGIEPALVYDGSSMILYKHDYQGASSAKMHRINPYSGEVTASYNLSLESSANGISWINTMTFHNGAIWVTGGYGDPSGSGGRIGIFKIDIASSKSSNQIPAGSGIDSEEELGGLASDGVNFYVGVNLTNVQPVPGIVKFDPGLVSEAPASPFFQLDDKPGYLCFGGGYLWAGIDSVKKIDPVSGTVLASYNLPRSAAQLYFDNAFWIYNEDDNTLKAFDVEAASAVEEKGIVSPSVFYLSQNYPNPFNPSTSISFGLPTQSFVSLKIFDLIGREVATLVSYELPAGYYVRQWNAASMSSGIYLYRLQGGTYSETKKLILLR